MSPSDIGGYATVGVVVVAGLTWVADRAFAFLHRHEKVATGQEVDHSKVTQLEGDFVKVQQAVETLGEKLTDLRIEYAEFKGSNEASHLHVTQSLAALSRSVEQMQAQIRLLATGVNNKVMEIEG